MKKLSFLLVLSMLAVVSANASTVHLTTEDSTSSCQLVGHLNQMKNAYYAHDYQLFLRTNCGTVQMLIEGEGQAEEAANKIEAGADASIVSLVKDGFNDEVLVIGDSRYNILMRR